VGDVDLENATVRVRRTLTRNGTGYLLGEPKTKKSRRTVRITPQAVEALKSHRAKQSEEMLTSGSLYQEQDLVFAGTGGGLIDPSNLRQRSFNPLLEHAGLPRITFNDLRHTCASLLFQKNVHPKFVQEQLGHASVAITLDTYSHMLPGMGSQAADAMVEALSLLCVAAPRPRCDVGTFSPLRHFTCKTAFFPSGRCWVRTSDLLLVREMRGVAGHCSGLQNSLI
jgi:integrase